jgi:hypothetical protein
MGACLNAKVALAQVNSRSLRARLAPLLNLNTHARKEAR